MPCDLRSSVGNNLKNLPEDVGTVQLFLQLIGSQDGGTPGLTVDGAFGGATDTAIRAFQQRQFAFDDGIVDPGDVTMKRLQMFFDASGVMSFGAARNEMLGLIGRGAAVVQGEVTSTDGVGQIVDAGSRKIYSHPMTGTWEVGDDILNAYKANLEETGKLGYPISGTRATGTGGTMNFFQHGTITQDPGQLAVPNFY